MKLTLNFILLTALASFTNSSIYTNKKNVLPVLKDYIINKHNAKPAGEVHLQKANRQNYGVKPTQRLNVESLNHNKNLYGNKRARFKARVKSIAEGVTPHSERRIDKRHFKLDPILNVMRRSDGRKPSIKSDSYSSDASSGSSSLEMQHWKDEWNEQWLENKFNAINSSRIRGDSVNMMAARPWGVPCGDPDQHDMPWGSCLLPMECESEYRIYRGDLFCGRTQFVCCSLMLNTYDMYQGIDESFQDSSLDTSSEEKKKRDKGSKETKRKEKGKEKKRRRRKRQKRKRKIKKVIRKITNEIKKILTRSYRNGTTERKRKTKQLKRFVKNLKQEFKKDRKAVLGIHENELIKIDKALLDKLNNIRAMNQMFIKNSTFRDLILNNTITPKVARILVQAYPELLPMINTRRSIKEPSEDDDSSKYDVEYGFLYYNI